MPPMQEMQLLEGIGFYDKMGFGHPISLRGSEKVLRESVDSFLNHLVVEKGFSPNTLEAYRNDLHQFMEFVQGRLSNGHPGDSLPASIGLDGAWSRIDLGLLVDYVSSLRGKKSYQDATTARKVATLKSFFNFLVQEETIEQDPTEFLTAPKVGRSLPKFLSEEEVERLLDEAAKEGSPEGKRDWAILEILYATGLRVSELVSLNTHDVNLQEGYIRCMGKGSKERIAYMYPRAAEVLRRYMEEARSMLLSPAMVRHSGNDNARPLGKRVRRQLHRMRRPCF